MTVKDSKILAGELVRVQSLLGHLERVVKAVATRDGTCWCSVRAHGLVNMKGEVRESVLHTVACDQLYLALYGSERGE